MEKPGGLSRLLHDLDLHIAIVFLLTLVTVTVSGVVMRYWVNQPLTWLEEVQLACFVWIVFVGACAVSRKTGHIAIDAFVGLFPRFLRKIAKTITHAVIIVSALFFGYYACLYVQQMFTTGRSTNILLIPYWLIYGIVPVACFYMAINSVLVLLGLRDPKPVGFVKERENV